MKNKFLTLLMKLDEFLAYYVTNNMKVQNGYLDKLKDKNDLENLGLT